MSIDEPTKENDSEEMAESIIDSVDDSFNEDGLTKGERRIEVDKESMRVAKAKELKKHLRRRELGLLNYRWPAVVLVFAGVLSIWTEFLVVMIHPPEIPGVNTFWITFAETGNIFFTFPLISGIIMIILGYLAYTRPFATYLSAVPAMMMAMSGITIYYLVTYGVTAQPWLEGEILATGVPLTMMIIGLLSLFSVMMREKE